MNQLETQQHLSTDLLIRMLDEEVSPAERLEVERHVAVCEACRLEFVSLGELSASIELVVQASRVPTAADTAFHRKNLQSRLEPVQLSSPSAPTAGGVMKRFGWGMAIAATLAFGILLAPRGEIAPVAPQMGQAIETPDMPAQPTTIEVDGETFTPLPYSNPDLPINASHVVQMEVPVSSLSEVGIVLEPVSNRVTRSEDASVLADVLVGSDGQPRAVHVLNAEQ